MNWPPTWSCRTRSLNHQLRPPRIQTKHFFLQNVLQTCRRYPPPTPSVVSLIALPTGNNLLPRLLSRLLRPLASQSFITETRAQLPKVNSTKPLRSSASRNSPRQPCQFSALIQPSLPSVLSEEHMSPVLAYIELSVLLGVQR
jgi:hypothetical protein